jgi:hypothetical protein
MVMSVDWSALNGIGVLGSKPVTAEDTARYFDAFIAALKDCGHRPQHVLEAIRRYTNVAKWNLVTRDGLPKYEPGVTYIGINTAGFSACFTIAEKDGTCWMNTGEESICAMGSLCWWRVLDRPEHGTQAWDASQIKPPGWNHVQQAFIDGAREARANPEATDADFGRASDGYTKRVFEEVDPASEAALRTESWRATSAVGGVDLPDGDKYE